MTDLEIYSAYLPYEVKIEYKIAKKDKTIFVLDIYTIGEFPTDQCKLILRPLESITDNEYHQLRIDCNLLDEYRMPTTHDLYYRLKNKLEADIFIFDYRIINWLIKNHFDVFGLIEQGKAINIKTL